MASPRILYLDTIPGDGIQQTALAGMRRYAGARGWGVEAVAVAESRPEKLKAVLAGNRPVAGCVVECADGRSDLPPRLFGKIPVAYFHAAPNLYGGRTTRLSTDNAAVAQVAFRELSAAAPAAFAVVGFRAAFAWSKERESAFAVLAQSSGRPFFAFRRIGGTRGRIDAGREARLARWLSALPARTAVFAMNDVTAAEVVAAARAAGRRIPQTASCA
ncbi:MAG: substrate-binding domain-containing protein [Kiritimatiellae bacterium]|nr:substrate-binding domain-containing protein [Kiritimatiellia bacterium]